MSFLFPQAPAVAAPPPPPPSLSSNSALLAGLSAQTAAAAAAGKAGFGRTVRTSSQGAGDTAKATPDLQPVMHFSSVFGG